MKVLLPARGNLLRLARVGRCLFACALLGFCSCKKNEPIDEAKAAGKTTADFPQITADVFKPMDGGIDLKPAEIMGRNTWNFWSGQPSILEFRLCQPQRQTKLQKPMQEVPI